MKSIAFWMASSYPKSSIYAFTMTLIMNWIELNLTNPLLPSPLTYCTTLKSNTLLKLQSAPVLTPKKNFHFLVDTMIRNRIVCHIWNVSILWGQLSAIYIWFMTHLNAVIILSQTTTINNHTTPNAPRWIVTTMYYKLIVDRSLTAKPKNCSSFSVKYWSYHDYYDFLLNYNFWRQ